MGSRALFVSALLLACCARTTLKGSVVDQHTSREETTELDFWDGLAEQRAVSNSDALHALILSFTQDDSPDHAARVLLATKRGWIRSGTEIPARETARVGWVARAVCLETGIEGGLTMRLIGPRQRYAVKELNHMRWLPEMSQNQAVSGLQLISVLSEAEDHLAGES